LRDRDGIKFRNISTDKRCQLFVRPVDDEAMADETNWSPIRWTVAVVRVVSGWPAKGVKQQKTPRQFSG
jgi:hypothetical protein